MPRYRNTSDRKSYVINEVIILKPGEEIDLNYELPAHLLIPYTEIEKIDNEPLPPKAFYEIVNVPANSKIEKKFNPFAYTDIFIRVHPDDIPKLTEPLKVVENYHNGDENSRYIPIDGSRAFQFKNYRFKKANIYSITIINPNDVDIRVEFYWDTDNV